MIGQALLPMQRGVPKGEVQDDSTNDTGSAGLDGELTEHTWHELCHFACSWFLLYEMCRL